MGAIRSEIGVVIDLDRGTDAELVRRCRARLSALFPDPPTSIGQLLDAARTVTGRQIRLVVADPWSADEPDGPLPSGLWARLDHDVDVVWVDGRTSRWHRLIVACHEFGHIFLGHQPAAPARDRDLVDMVENLLAPAESGRPRITQAHVTAIMGRCGQPIAPRSTDWTAEREAELAGRFLAQRMSSRADRAWPLGL